MSRKRKEGLKSVLCEDARGLCEKDTTNLEFLCSEKLVESLREAKETFKVSKSMVKDNSSTPSFNKRLYALGCSRTPTRKLCALFY